MPEFVCAAVTFPPSKFFPTSVPADTDYCANSIRLTTPAGSEGQSPEGVLYGLAPWQVGSSEGQELFRSMPFPGPAFRRGAYGGKAERTANPVQATAIFGAKRGLCREAIDARFPLQYEDFPLGRALSSAG
jgi:hypothetical protein